jgi:hypothetical protein
VSSVPRPTKHGVPVTGSVAFMHEGKAEPMIPRFTLAMLYLSWTGTVICAVQHHIPVVSPLLSRQTA